MTNEKDKTPSLPTDQERELPDSIIDSQITELYGELFKTMAENVTIEEYETLEGQPIAIIRDSRDRLSLMLKNNNGSFERLGGNRADDIPEETVYSTFKWLKGKKIKNFTDLSEYLRKAAENKSK